MPLDDVQRNDAFRALQPLLARFSKRWKAKLSYNEKTALGFYSVEVKGPGSPAFATLFAHLADVRVYFHPLNIWKDLAESVPAAARKRIVSKSIFAFKTPPTPEDKAALAKIFAEAERRIDERMMLAPKLPYTKKLSAKQLAALEGGVAARPAASSRAAAARRPVPRTSTQRTAKSSKARRK